MLLLSRVEVWVASGSHCAGRWLHLQEQLLLRRPPAGNGVALPRRLSTSGRDWVVVTSDEKVYLMLTH